MTFIPALRGRTLPGNSTATPLAGAATFTGTAEDVSAYPELVVGVISDVSGTFTLEFSSDSTNWDFTETVAYTLQPNFTYTTAVKARYYRLVYVNGTSAQTFFRLQSIARIASPSSSSGSSETKVSLGVTNTNPIFDAFNRFRVSNPETLLEVTHQISKNDSLETEALTGSATSTWNSNTASVTLAVTGGTDSVYRQSRRNAVYQPGKSLLCLFTGVLDFGSNTNNTVASCGLYNATDGLFFSYQNGTTLAVNVRTSTSGSAADTQILQSAWNIDKMDGTGPSGITVDPTQAQIFAIDFEWLGVGQVRFGFVQDGIIYYCHLQQHSNVDSKVYMKRAFLPIRYEMLSVGGSGSVSMICYTVVSEGGFNPIAETFSATRTASLQVSGTPLPVISIRLASGSLRQAIPITKGILQVSNGAVIGRAWLYRDVASATILTGATWTAAHADSSVEYDVSATAVNLTTTPTPVPIDTLLAGRFESSEANTDLGNILTINEAGTSDVLVITCQTLTGNEDVVAFVTWGEQPY